jgi:tetraacyldisaccharide 4'-kinase
MNRGRWEQGLTRIWYGNSKAFVLMLPFSLLFCAFVQLRRLAYRKGFLPATRLGCKVVVVGNITVGGTGKTPLVIALARYLGDSGLKVGILTRGYAGRAAQWPRRVSADSDPCELGDEAVLLARKSGVVVFAGPDRCRAGQALLGYSPCDVIICDDGLQHYALQRDVEIATVDATRGNGNGFCLPAGPLREPESRLREQAVSLHLSPTAVYRVSNPADTRSLESFAGESVHAVAGIANPQRFFQMLRGAGLDIEAHRFADHHAFRSGDVAFGDDNPVLMTEKDAVKCQSFLHTNLWCVPIEVQLEPGFGQWLLKKALA